MVILATTKAHLGIAALAATTLIVGASYTLLMIKQTFHGPIVNPKIKQLQDVSVCERIPLTLLVIAILGLGVYPKPLISMMHQSVDHLNTIALKSHLPKTRAAAIKKEQQKKAKATKKPAKKNRAYRGTLKSTSGKKTDQLHP